jgi:hypothetical protein
MNGRWRKPVAVAALVALAAGAACDGKPPTVVQPLPGVLSATLASPHAEDGALLLRVTGPGPIGDVQGGAGYVVHARPAGDGVRIAVFGNVVPGEVVRFHVPDVHRADAYAVTVVEAAGRDNALRGLHGYAVTVAAR